MNMSYPAEWETDYTTNGLHIVFRPVLSTDLEMLWDMFSTLSDESVSNLLPPLSRERIVSWTTDINYDEVLAIVAVITEDNKQRIIGDASLRFNQLEAVNHKAELGLTVHDDYQNMGIGTALLNHMIAVAKLKRLSKIYLHANVSNDRAIHVYEKAGFVKEGTLRNESCVNGKYRDEYRMAILL
jgi:RimJ/RimL family protein N-acetyltransferase